MPCFENHSSYWERRSGSLFVVHGYQGAEEDAAQLLLTDKLLQAVLAEAQVVSIGQPMLIAVDDFWTMWCKSAEAGLFRAYSKAGGPTEAGRSAFLGRGLLRIRSRRLGGRAVGSKGSSTLRFRKLSLNCLFVGRDNNNFDLCRPPGN